MAAAGLGQEGVGGGAAGGRAVIGPADPAMALLGEGVVGLLVTAPQGGPAEGGQAHRQQQPPGPGAIHRPTGVAGGAHRLGEILAEVILVSVSPELGAHGADLPHHPLSGAVGAGEAGGVGAVAADIEDHLDAIGIKAAAGDHLGQIAAPALLDGGIQAGALGGAQHLVGAGGEGGIAGDGEAEAGGRGQQQGAATGGSGEVGHESQHRG